MEIGESTEVSFTEGELMFLYWMLFGMVNAFDRIEEDGAGDMYNFSLELLNKLNRILYSGHEPQYYQ